MFSYPNWSAIMTHNNVTLTTTSTMISNYVADYFPWRILPLIQFNIIFSLVIAPSVSHVRDLCGGWCYQLDAPLMANGGRRGVGGEGEKQHLLFFHSAYHFLPRSIYSSKGHQLLPGMVWLLLSWLWSDCGLYVCFFNFKFLDLYVCRFFFNFLSRSAVMLWWF